VYWGEGSALGLLTFLGYLLFTFGAALVWRGREEVSVWIRTRPALSAAVFALYRSRPFLRPRSDSRLKAVPASFARSFCRIPRRPTTGGVILAFLDLCCLLDFFI